MKFLSLALPFRQQPSSSRKGQVDENDAGLGSTMGDKSSNAASDSSTYKQSLPHHSASLMPVPASNGLPIPSSTSNASTSTSTSTRARSTPPAFVTAEQQQHHQDPIKHSKERRKSLLRSPSRTSLKRVVNGTSSGAAAKDNTVECHQLPADDTTPSMQPTQRRRRKSLKNILIPSSFKTGQVSPSAPGSHPPSSPADPDTAKAPQQPRRRYSFASPSTSSTTTSSSSPASTTSPTSIRKSNSTSAFRQNKDSQHLESNIPPVPALPAHIPLANLSPIQPILSKRPSSTYLPSPQTPTSTTTSSALQAPQSAKSATSSTLSSPPQDNIPMSQITRSSSIPTLYTSPDSTASPSSTGTLATPRTTDMRSPPQSAQRSDVQRERVELGEEEGNKKKTKQELSPLLLGPCFSDALLSSDTLHTAEILRALHERQEDAVVEEVKSEDGYGSDGHDLAMSTESDDYGAASNLSHGTQTIEGVSSSLAGQVDKAELNTSEAMEKHITADTLSGTQEAVSTSSMLRVDTSIATSSSLFPLNTVERSSAYDSSNTPPASLSPLSHSFPTSSIYTMKHQHLSSDSSSSASRNAYSRTPTPTALTPVPSHSPRLLSQGAKICLGYTISRLKKDGNSSTSTQPEKVNLLQWGGRRYPCSTRPLSLSPLKITSSLGDDREFQSQISQLAMEDQATHQYAPQRRREPRSVNLYKELAWIGIIRKLQSRRRLTLMEEVELDGFKKLRTNWTPCSSPLVFEFSQSASDSTTPRHVPPDATISKTDTSGAPPSSVTKAISLQNESSPRSIYTANQARLNTSTQPASVEQGSQQSVAIPSPPPPTTSALITSEAFLKAQESAWKSWMSRLPFEERMTSFLPNGECLKIVPECKGRLVISDRIHAWATATLEDVSLPIAMEYNQGNNSNTTLVIERPKSIVKPTALLAYDGRRNKNENAEDGLPASSIIHVKAESDGPPFTKNRISMFMRRTSLSDDADQVRTRGPSKGSPAIIKASASSSNKNGRNSFGQALAARLGFRSGKSKISASNSESKDREVSPARTDTTQESSSASSMINTATSKSTPATSTSSACSDQTDADITLTARELNKPVRPERSTLRPPREPRPISMMRPASHGPYPSEPTRAHPPVQNDHQRPAYGSLKPGHAMETAPPMKPLSMIPKSHSDQRLSTYSTRGASHEQDRRLSTVASAEGSAAPHRRVRVLSQPEGVLSVRPHSMFVQPQAHSRQRSSEGKTKARPTSQFLETPRPKSLLVANGLAGNDDGPYNYRKARTLSASQSAQQIPAIASIYDDDETPLAVLRRNSGTPPSLPSSLKDDSSLPEARPRLKSAMRSSSQPRPVSMLSQSNRNSMMLSQEIGQSSRSSSPASLNRLSVHHPDQRNGRNSWHQGEETLKSLIREEQLKEEHEAKELKRRREQRKIWEDHRRRSVFLDEQAAAAEKAANEANRRQSHLYMSMALAQPQPQPYVQPMLWANGIPNTPYGMQQAPLFLQPQVQQPVYNARPTIMHSRPTSYYHQGQTTNGQSGQILNGQSSISYGQYVVGPPYQNQMR